MKFEQKNNVWTINQSKTEVLALGKYNFPIITGNASDELGKVQIIDIFDNNLFILNKKESLMVKKDSIKKDLMYKNTKTGEIFKVLTSIDANDSFFIIDIKTDKKFKIKLKDSDEIPDSEIIMNDVISNGWENLLNKPVSVETSSGLTRNGIITEIRFREMKIFFDEEKIIKYPDVIILNNDTFDQINWLDVKKIVIKKD